MPMRPPSRILLALLAAACPVLAAAGAAAPAKPSRFAQLMARVSSYLNSQPVREAQVEAAVAAVRGGHPVVQGEDLDQRLLDRVQFYRKRILSPDATKDDAPNLRKAYHALAASQWVQAAEAAPKSGAAGEAVKAARSWTAAGVPQSLANYLKTAEAKDLSGDNLAKHEWAAYCHAITPDVAGEPEAVKSIDSETAKLDEQLAAVGKALKEKKLTDEDQARALLLAGYLYNALSEAPLKTGAAAGPNAMAAATSKPIELVAPAASPKVAADTAPDFSPRRIYAKAARSVVLIMCADQSGSGELGSGSVIDGGGHVLTNAHVVIQQSSGKPWPAVRVYFKPEKMTGDPKQDLNDPVEGKVVSYDRGLDLALLELEGSPKVAPLALGDPGDVVVGDHVAAIGHPEQGGLWTLTTGVVSTVVANVGGVKGKNVFQTDASINRGNSGGPLLNADGDIIGVNTLMSRKASDGLAITAVNFSVKSDVAKRWIASAGGNISYGKPAPAFDDKAVKAAPKVQTAPPPPTVVDKPSSVTGMGGVAAIGGGSGSGGLDGFSGAAAGGSSRAGIKDEAGSVTPAPKRQMVTESKPFNAQRLIEEEMKELEDLGDEMHQQIMRKKAQMRQQDQ